MVDDIYARLEQRVTVLEEDMREIKGDIKSLRNDLTTRLDKVDLALTTVITGALNSMPQWAAQSLKTNSSLVGALTGVVGTLVVVILALLHYGAG